MEQLSNWRTQIKKGYLELCILIRIESKGRVYGFELIEDLKQNQLLIKEGTIYPLFNRMAEDKILVAHWETAHLKGHPRKFYSLTPYGQEVLMQMKTEFEEMYKAYTQLLTDENK